ncbi:unnamed protein product, partial [Staurois parvus]
MTAQLSVELVQCRVAKRGLVIKGGKSSGVKVVKIHQNVSSCLHAINIIYSMESLFRHVRCGL